jgi:hypothetical protein
MKKLLLPALFMFAATVSNAQTCQESLNATGVYEDFSSAKEFSNPDKSGIYNWGNAVGSDPAHPAAGAVITRDTVAHVLKVKVSQGQNDYAPFGTTFGTIGGVAGGKPVVIDVTNNSKFSIKVTNNDPAITIRFRMTIVDSMKNEIDTYAVVPSPEKAGNGGKTYLTDTAFGNAYKYTLEAIIAPNATVTFSGDFAGGAKADYSKNKYVKTFNYKAVAGIHYTVTNQANTGAPNYQTLAISNLPISIVNFAVGACPNIKAGINELAAGVLTSSIYPNPATESFTAALELKEISNVRVTLHDLMGREISVIADTKTASLNETFNVSTIAKGTYMVKYTVNGANAVTKLLLVK